MGEIGGQAVVSTIADGTSRTLQSDDQKKVQSTEGVVESPMARLIKLLSGIKGNVEQEGITDQQLYDTHDCKFKSDELKLRKSAEQESQRRPQLLVDIDESQSSINTLQEEVKQQT